MVAAAPVQVSNTPQLHVVSVSISVYGHPAQDSLGAGDYKAHVQVS